ncbi:MAG: type IX secretion system membrane protein PorP/SprF [Bacteroidota bacterium]
MQRNLLKGILFLFFLIPISSFGQQDAQFTQYMFNGIFYNPAYAGVEGVTRLSVLHRSQWLGYEPVNDFGVAPTTQLFSLTAPIFRYNSGFGAHVVSDKLGAQNNLEFQLSYAYHLETIKDTKLSFGIRFGMISQTFDFDDHRWIDLNDVFRREGKESQVRPDIALGAFFRAEKYYLGASFNHLLRSQFDFGLDSIRNSIDNHAYVTFGYIFEQNRDLEITPSFLVKTDLNSYSFDMGVVTKYKDQMWIGVTYRQSESVNAILGYSFLEGKDKNKHLRLSYAFDYVIGEVETKGPTSHELMISYDLPTSFRVKSENTRNPRYR